MATYVRYAFANGTGSSRTVTFSEGEPLDSSHVLVVFHYHNQSSDPTTPTGWTRVLINTSNSGRRFYIYVRRADGSVNSFTFASGTSNVAWASAMFAYKSDEGSLTLGTATGNTTAFNDTSISSSPVDPGGYGVALSWAWVSNGSTPRTWADGFEEVVLQSGIFPAAEKLTDQQVTPSISWGTPALGSINTVFIPLESPPEEDNLEYFAWDGVSLEPLDALGVMGGE